MLVGFRVSCSSNKQVYENLLSKKTPNVLVCVGPAGSGKTMLACKHAIQKLNNKEYKKIIITRPTVSVDEELGFLPGEIENKMYPFMVPLYEQLEKYMDKAMLCKQIKSGVIEILPLGFIRGRTFDNTFVIADEMQNSTKSQMLTLLTRIGYDSKIVITGDMNQSDNSKDNGLKDFLKKKETSFLDTDGAIDVVKFDEDDVMRSEIVKLILKLYCH